MKIPSNTYRDHEANTKKLQSLQKNVSTKTSPSNNESRIKQMWITELKKNY